MQVEEKRICPECNGMGELAASMSGWKCKCGGSGYIKVIVEKPEKKKPEDKREKG